MNGLLFDALCVAGLGGPRLRELSLKIEPGQCVFLLGPNGAGKSTLLRAALGLERPSAGRVLLDGRDVARMSARERASHVAWLPQQWAFEQALTTVEVVAIARYRFSESRARAEDRARYWLERVGAAKLACRRVTELSGGEQQRVKLAALLAQETPLLLVDEPANHLDPAQELEVYQTLAAQWRRGLGVVCVTHDINWVSSSASAGEVRLVGIKAGQLCFDTALGDPELTRKLESLYDVAFERLERSPSVRAGSGRAGHGSLFVPRPRSGEAKGRA